MPFTKLLRHQEQTERMKAEDEEDSEDEVWEDEDSEDEVGEDEEDSEDEVGEDEEVRMRVRRKVMKRTPTLHQMTRILNYSCTYYCCFKKKTFLCSVTLFLLL